MFKLKNYSVKLFLLLIFFITSKEVVSQCNVSSSICANSSPSFNFTPTNGPYAGGSFANAGCATGAGGQHSYSFITLYITASGPLNLLIQGNVASGFIDVAIFNIPNGVIPCNAVLNSQNAIGCNFASQSGGCVQFGTSFPCGSSVPAPYVTAGQQIMIVAQSYSSGGSTSYSMQLSPSGAQSGQPNSNINPVNPVCQSANPFQLTAVNMGGSWSGPGVTPSGMFNPNTAGVGVHTINYTIGVAPCNSTSSVDIEVLPSPVLTPIAPQTICPGGSATLTTSGADSYTWSPSNGLLSTAGSSVIASPTQTFSYLVTGTNAQGCTATTTAQVIVGPPLAVTASGNAPICKNESFLMNVTNHNDAIYSWTGPNGFTSNLSSPILPNVQPNQVGNYVVTVTVNGCSNSDSVALSLNPQIFPIIDPVANLCSNSTPVQLTANMGPGTWFGPYVSNSGIFTPNVSNVGDNVIYYALDMPCGDTSSVVIKVIQEPIFDFVADKETGCKPLEVLFTINSLTPFDLAGWDFGTVGYGNVTSMLDTISHTYSSSGDYSLTLTLYNSICSSTVSKNNLIHVYEDPIANFTANSFEIQMIDPTISLFNQSEYSVNYIWEFGDFTGSTEVNPIHSYVSEEATYLVTLYAFNEAGCYDSIIKPVKVVPGTVYFVPNSFTPDGDEYNNVFKPIFSSGFNLHDYTFTVYNRWGEIIFVSHDADYGWDGTYNNSLSPDGIYNWSIVFGVPNVDDRKVIYGHVTLMR